MLLTQSIPFRRRRVYVPALPVLLRQASYEAGASLTLKFNQPVSIAQIAANSFELDDGPGGHIYIGASAVLVDALTVKINLAPVTSDTGPNVKLNADDANGITSIQTAQMWAGADGLVLPYPS